MLVIEFTCDCCKSKTQLQNAPTTPALPAGWSQVELPAAPLNDERAFYFCERCSVVILVNASDGSSLLLRDGKSAKIAAPTTA